MTSNKMVDFLNCKINDISIDDLLKQLDTGIIYTPNVDHIINLQRNKNFYNSYKFATYTICDSRILQIFSYILWNPIRNKISGSDFFPAFCHYHEKNDHIQIFLLGAAPNVAQAAKSNLNKKHGREIVVETYSPSFGFEHDEKELSLIVEEINNSNANVLAVGLGSPKQELWIHNNIHKLPNIQIAMAIGASIDFESGQTKRAPFIFQKLGFEWLYRLMKEPRRLWKRYLLKDMYFIVLVTKKIFGKYRSPF